MVNGFAFGVGGSRFESTRDQFFLNFLLTRREGLLGSVKRCEGLRVSIRVSLVIKHKFSLKYACFADWWKVRYITVKKTVYIKAVIFTLFLHSGRVHSCLSFDRSFYSRKA